MSCSRDAIESYVYMVITAAANYMIFSEGDIISPQMQLVKTAITMMIEQCVLDFGEDGKRR